VSPQEGMVRVSRRPGLPQFVIPAKAGIQRKIAKNKLYWIPACAGMTT
jgi:hypothetical protein